MLELESLIYIIFYLFFNKKKNSFVTTLKEKNHTSSSKSDAKEGGLRLKSVTQWNKTFVVYFQ